MGLDLGERPFLQVRKGPVDHLPDDEAEDRVAEELQPLVVGRPDLAILVGEGLVGQRPLEQIEVAKRVARAIAGRSEGRLRRNDAHEGISGAGGRSRTGTGLAALGILSPVRLPIPPLRRVGIARGPSTIRGESLDPESSLRRSWRFGFGSRLVTHAEWRRRADSNRRIKVLQTSPLTTWVRRQRSEFYRSRRPPRLSGGRARSRESGR